MELNQEQLLLGSLLGIVAMALVAAIWRSLVILSHKEKRSFSLAGTGYVMDGGCLLLVDVEGALLDRKELIDEINALAIPIYEAKDIKDIIS